MPKLKTKTEYVIIGSDFSAQEPRLLSHLADEPKLKETFAKNRDPYATISQFVFHKDYWECMEHNEDGTPNPEGKKLRKKAKGIMLGILYGMGAKLMSQNLGVTIDECKEILDNFFKMFPKVKEFTEYNEKCARENKYVEDYLGRRRHLPDYSLDEIEVRAKKNVFTNADVFIDCTKDDALIQVPDDEVIAEWTKRWKEFETSKKFNAKKEFKELAKRNDVELYDNGAFISKATTQITNSRIQGSAASLTKKAMVAIHRDDLMKKYGFRLMIPVHDELLGECKMYYAEEASNRLTELMVGAALPECSVKMKCDAYCVKHWYADDCSHQIYEDFTKYVNWDEKNGKLPISESEAFEKMKETYCELNPEILWKMCHNEFDELSVDV